MMNATTAQNRTAVWLLALSVFAISTAELLPMGLLLDIAQQYQVSIKTAGLVVSVYALGVVIGGPLLTMWTARMPRKSVVSGIDLHSSPLNIRVLKHAEGAQDLASSLNIAAFNLGNAGGALIGGYVAESVYGLQGLPVASALLTVTGIFLLLWGLALERRKLCGKKKCPLPQSA